ncbi:hypothetical protein ABT084_18000 [Streptomyces sp. NPDC002138]|uniref:hypothetical protein n=1 Tax=Streptomyces sp. NPDC002138 TaxID=3154410 RepID=UPI0033343E7C
MPPRTRGALPALLIATALTLTGCGTATPKTTSAGTTTVADQAEPGATPPAEAVAADTATAPAEPKARYTPTAGSLPVSVVPEGKPAKLALVAPAPAGSGRPAPEAGAPDLKLTSYDQRTGEAVLAPAEGAPQPGRTAAAAAVKAGQLIDSPPSPAAPRGALVAITAVKRAEGGKTAVSTRPATVSELLGDSSASLHTALDPRSITVEPQVKDLKVSFTPRADGGNGSVSGGLKLDANTKVPLPHGASVDLSGSVRIDPSIDFSYDGHALSPRQAGVGFQVGARANWRVSTAIAGSAEPIRIPLAKLHSTPTVMAGPVPVVFTLDLTLYATVGADGKVTVDVEQRLAADWGIHSDYTKGKGWTTEVEPGTTNISPVRAELNGSATVRTGLDLEGSVALYDAVGVKAAIKPYLRSAVEGSVVIESGGAAPVVHGKAGLHGGLGIDGALMARIAIFGTPLFEKEIPLAGFRREWPIVTRSTGTTTATPAPAPTKS